ncbi:hypothetical protein SPFM10_00189 [Salmonella phage SPFM10]|nr:hypothetical protein SPFM10_00189 [Salmonella phage SPFM10]
MVRVTPVHEDWYYKNPLNYGRVDKDVSIDTFYKYLLFYSRYNFTGIFVSFPDDPSLNYFLSVGLPCLKCEVTPFNGPYADAWKTRDATTRGIYWTGQNAFQDAADPSQRSSFIAGVVCRPDGQLPPGTLKYFSVDRIAQFLKRFGARNRPGWKVVRAMGQFYMVAVRSVPHQTGSRYTFCVMRFMNVSDSELNTRIW